MPDRFADTIPLPDHLLECGCRNAKMGWHSSSCVPAREYEATPLKDRPGYGVGQAFRSVGWEFPFRFTADITYEVEIDVVAYIAAHQEEYDEFVLEAGYEAWEKPAVFISSIIEDDVSANDLGWRFGQPRWVSRSVVDVGEIREYPPWTAEDSDRLKGPVDPVDPNQGTLNV